MLIQAVALPAAAATMHGARRGVGVEGTRAFASRPSSGKEVTEKAPNKMLFNETDYRSLQCVL
jgi:hypothetical protein